MSKDIKVFIGWDSREAAATEVAAYSIKKRTKLPVQISYLKHRELRKGGLFTRPWLVDSTTGNYTDLIDNKPFSTEFSHTRFLVPALMNYKGWALFFDADMIFQSDIQELFKYIDDRYAVMCVKHDHKTKDGAIKMDDRAQLAYHRKNWSSFVLFNCGHPANAKLTKEYISFARGVDLHTFSWLKDSEIGALPFAYNFISGVSPKIDSKPAVIHYTEGGPWFEGCGHVPYADLWLNEYEDCQRNREEFLITDIPTMACDKEERC